MPKVDLATKNIDLGKKIRKNGNQIRKNGNISRTESQLNPGIMSTKSVRQMTSWSNDKWVNIHIISEIARNRLRCLHGHLVKVIWSFSISETRSNAHYI